MGGQARGCRGPGSHVGNAIREQSRFPTAVPDDGTQWDRPGGSAAPTTWLENRGLPVVCRWPPGHPRSQPRGLFPAVAPQESSGGGLLPRALSWAPTALVLQPGGLWTLTVWWSRHGWQVYWKLANWQYLRDPQSSSMMHSCRGRGRGKTASSGKAGQQVHLTWEEKAPLIPPPHPPALQAQGAETGSSAPQAGGPLPTQLGQAPALWDATPTSTIVSVCSLRSHPGWGARRPRALLLL